jgi:hypothetical protein
MYSQVKNETYQVTIAESKKKNCTKEKKKPLLFQDTGDSKIQGCPSYREDTQLFSAQLLDLWWVCK